MNAPRILGFTCEDIRFPTSDSLDGSDAMHQDPDYSAAYVVLRTDHEGLEGHGLTFTIGRGNDVVRDACALLAAMCVGRSLDDITSDFAGFWRELTSDSQLRWLGPEKGVIHIATAAVVNAIWDLWAKHAGKPLWKLVCDLEPEEVLSLIDWRYLSDAMTKDEALAILRENKRTMPEREAALLKTGYPAYTTSAGWLGYDDDKIRRLCREGMAASWSHFKIKVGADLEDDRRRCRIVREEIGPERTLMVDANQRWDVDEAIRWMRELAEFRPLWIEEPTSPDDVLGHAAIAKSLAPLGIGVATGEQCQNRVVFKQLLQARAIAFCQIDSCRLGGPNEILAVLLLAKKFGVPVCPHAGGVGLCEYVAHLVFIDALYVAGTCEGRVAEFVDHLHEHFVDPCVVEHARYQAPTAPGYSITMKPASIEAYRFPDGEVWRARARRN